MDLFGSSGSDTRDVTCAPVFDSEVTTPVSQPLTTPVSQHEKSSQVASISTSTTSESSPEPLKKTVKERDRSTNVEQSCIAGATAGDQRAGDSPSVPPKAKERKPRAKAPKVPKQISPEDQRRLDEFHKLKAEWMEAHELQFEDSYGFTGRDAKAVKTLLTFGTASEVLDVAIQAWSNHGRPGTFYLKQARTIYGLADHWNQIKAELRDIRAGVIGVARSARPQEPMTKQQQNTIEKLKKIRFTSSLVES